MSAVLALDPPMPATPPPVGDPPRRWAWTHKQYRKLDELGFFNGRRVELVFGVIIEMSPPGWPHALAVSLVADTLRPVFAGVAWVHEQNPFQAAGSEPQPDVAVIPGQRRSYTDHPAVALLTVEVADTSLDYDTTTKAELYATAGVPEYWVLDLTNRLLIVFRDPAPLPAGLGATAYQSRQVFDPNASVTPLHAPNASVRVADLLP